MKLDLIKNFFLYFSGLLLLLTLPALVSASPLKSCSEPKTGDIKVELDFATRPVKTGSNEVIVKLFDAVGKPVSGAEVTVITAHPSQTEAKAQPQTGTTCNTEAETGHESAPAGEHDLAEMAIQAGPEGDHHQPSPAGEHDMAEMPGQAGTGTDSHSPLPAAEHDMAEMAGIEADEHQPAPEASHSEGHSGGHGEPGPAELAARPTPGEYEGQVSFTSAGQWLVKVNLSAQGHSQEVEFTVDVVKRGPNWYILGGFLSVNMGVVAAAAIMKQRAAKA